MAIIIDINDALQLTGVLGHWAYNALDCCGTREVYDVIERKLSPTTRLTYEFEMATQSPAMAMMRRGVLVDEVARSRAVEQLETDELASHTQVNKLIPPGVWTRTQLRTGKCADGKPHRWPRGVPDEERSCSKCGQARVMPAPFNPLSDDQGKELFYKQLGFQELYNKKGVVSVDEDTLYRLAKKHPEVKPLVDEILNTRGIRKSISFVSATLSSDGRMRSSFNVGAPETGRWSSSANAYREGTNLQNIPEKSRFIFVADPGMELFYADLEQAESKCVAYLAGDERYIEAHNLGDVHTYAARLIWPNLPWTGDLKQDKKIAEELHPDWDKDHSYRYNSKRIQHGSNYGLTPRGIAQLAHITVAAAEEAQGNYFEAFPYIPVWQKSVVAELKRSHTIITPLGRRRVFFGRHWDTHVQRQAIAQVPQSMVADILNLALWRVWNELDPEPVMLLAQIHDAILGQVKLGDDAAVQRVLELMQIPVPINGRVMVIGVDCKRGRNWGKHSTDNPGGMK